MNRIEGPFHVRMLPEALAHPDAPLGMSRFRLDKRYEGVLDAVGRGEMLALRTAVEGSAGYVALEYVEGTLAGRRGSFVLQHSGVMERGMKRLFLEVVPDSGSGGLVGLAGRMGIDIAGGEHFYRFEYSLPGAE
ncbi:DUF3224 domain-containing protein [Silanimonas lenta]|uniref:DUF3224 domain-containing protein n=1 Tax=Silanimonas lenta TaxID=265429 RepID=UPI002FE3A135